MKRYTLRILEEIVSRHYRPSLAWSDAFLFYIQRLGVAPNYGLVQGRELIKMICRCAFNDSTLTDNESVVIMETCLDPALDNMLLEVNFNEGWS